MLGVAECTVRTKKRPAMHPTGTQSARARGSLIVASPHSSAMDVIIPMAENLIEVSIEIESDNGKRPELTCIPREVLRSRS